MTINFFLGFTKCEGFCKFCEKGNNLIYFGKQDFYNINENLNFCYFETENDFKDASYKVYDGFTDINISGFEPLFYPELYNYLLILKKNNPNSTFTLKTSGLLFIDTLYLDFFDKIEFSIYGNDENTHNQIVGNNNAWYLFNKNIENFISSGNINKIFFQTILINSNKSILIDLIKICLDYNDNPFKIIYPRFIPKNNIKELIGRKESLKYILDNVPDIYFKRLILNNFMNNSKLEKYFYQVSI